MAGVGKSKMQERGRMGPCSVLSRCQENRIAARRLPLDSDSNHFATISFLQRKLKW